VLPRDGAALPADSSLAVSWLEEWNAALYRVEFETTEGTPQFAAMVQPGVGSYRAPPLVMQKAAGKPLRWRVVALDFDGREMRRSAWRTVKAAVAAPAQ
jgi:hypothetical protein